MNQRLSIFVQDEGWDVVALVEEDTDFLFLRTIRCAVIRRWGTTAGLGELAVKGPLPNTILDNEPGGGKIGKRSIKREIPCNVRNWSEWLQQII